MRFPGIRLVEQIEQKFRRIRACLQEKKLVTVIVGLFYYIVSVKYFSTPLELTSDLVGLINFVPKL